MLRKYAEEVFKKIVSQNHMDSTEAIPHSDVLAKFVESNIGLDSNLFKMIISILKDSHKILIMQVTKNDKDREIEGVEGYLDADISTVRKMKALFQRVLSDMYEEEYHKKIHPHMIVRELFPIMNRINRTPLGSIANKTIMLDEFEKLLQKEFNEYTEDWKARELDQLLEKHEKSFTAKVKESGTRKEQQEEKPKKTTSMRAVDSPDAGNLANTSLEKVLQIYGVEFFFRINLRKYNFDYIAEIIDARKIRSKNDLKLLKKMIQTLKNNTDRDPKLIDFIDKINRLDRLVSRYINIG
jgi:predicted house-cleaning noncanonical NTP pyrophosphatase (MazG superfamily)